MLSWKSVYWSWLKSYFSEIAAVRQFLDIIIKACTGEQAIPRTNRAGIEKLPDPSINYKYDKLKMKSICKKISFLSDNFLLNGILHIPAVEKGHLVIGSHGLLSSGNSPKQIELARRCNDFGIAFFRFDHRGCGKSEGVFKEVTSLNARCTDILCAIETIRGYGYIDSRIGLFGSSLGGTACLSAAGKTKIDSMVVSAAPLRSRMIKRPDENEDKVEYNKLSFDISGKLSAINNILIFHGDADQVVPFSSALEIYENAGDTKKLIIQENGDHLMSNKAHQEEFICEAGLWFRNGLFAQG